MISWRFLPVIFFGLFILLFWRGLRLNPHYLPSVKIGQMMPSFILPRLGGEGEFSSEKLKGHPFLLNVWASWCQACEDDHLFLIKLAQQDIPIYGLNYKDQSSTARNWLKEWGNPYRDVGFDPKGLVGVDLGVYGTPETFLIDAQGIIRLRHAGPMTDAIWKTVFLPAYLGVKEAI